MARLGWTVLNPTISFWGCCPLLGVERLEYATPGCEAVSTPLEMTQRDVAGFAIGGLSGGEEKDQFWRMVALSTAHLPRDKPRYLMGVG